MWLECFAGGYEGFGLIPRCRQCCSNAYLGVIMVILNFLVSPQQQRYDLKKAIVQQQKGQRFSCQNAVICFPVIFLRGGIF